MFLWLCFTSTNNSNYPWENVRSDFDGTGFVLLFWGVSAVITGVIFAGTAGVLGALGLLIPISWFASLVIAISVRAIFSLHKPEARQHWSEVLL